MGEQIKDPMQYIWDRIPKTKEGLIHYLPGDIPYLYLNGFVDTERYTYEQWKAAFDDCLQSDGTYLVSYEKFMSLRTFRYDGPVFKPFDPQKVREGEWDDEELQTLFDKSIKPSSSVTKDIFWNSVRALKKQGFVAKNGNLLVNKTVKTQLNFLVERFPSTRRKLEKAVAIIREEREQELHGRSADRNASTFVAGKLASESKKEAFEKLEGKKTVAAKPAKAKGKPEVDLKKLRKPSRKISG